MIDQKFLQGRTDEQINIMTAWVKLRSGVDASNMSEYLYAFQRGWSTRRLRVLFNPCTSPNDAWPIIIANSIEISGKPDEYSGQARASSFVGGLFSVADGNDRLLRAAMEVYLLMSNKS